MYDRLLGDPAVDALLTEDAYLQAMLDAEAALAHACAGAGLIPAESARQIAACAQIGRFDADSIWARAAIHATPVVPLVEDLRDQVPIDTRAAVHTGATSQDIIDTATALLARAALAAIGARLDTIAARLADLALRHAGDAQIGRTLLQHAQPTTFGLVCAGWLTGVDDARAGLVRVRDERLAVQLGGAVGNRAAYGAAGSAVARAMADRLGLADPVLPWHTDRQRIGEIAAACALAGGALATIGRNVAILAQTEIGELAEGTPGGSSAMPHKRNPARAVLVVAAAQQIPGIAAGLFAGMAGEAQRAAGAWQAEAPAIRHLLHLLGGAAWHTDAMLAGLRVDTARMRAALDARPAPEQAAAPVTDLIIDTARELVGRALAERDRG